MMYFKKNKFLIVMTSVLIYSGCWVENRNFTIHSPDGKTEVGLEIQNDSLFYTVSREMAQIIESSSIGLELNKSFEGGFRIISSSADSSDECWKPAYGEYSTIRDHYNSFEVRLEEKGNLHRRFNLFFRVYNEGVAFRYVLPEQEDSVDWQINNELSTFRFPEGTAAFPIYRTEQTYSNEPIDFERIEAGALLPLTVRLPDKFASLLEANVDNYPNTCLDKTTKGDAITRLCGKAKIDVPFATPWRVILIADDEGGLIENESMILNLNPACQIKDLSWIEAGKTISNENSGIGLQTEKLKKLVDFASENGFKYLQLDWGWYGTEVKWSDDQIQSFSKVMPEKFKNSGWEENAQANPYTVAKGYVPYGWTDRWKDSYTEVDLDIEELVAYARAKGVGISLYVEAGHTLHSHNLDSLFSQYEEWGLAGLKPGFVEYGTQENTNWIRKMVEIAARHHLLLCIHDARIPDGTSRTYPNLIINEGGGGQEGNHPVVQDVMLPFCRCLAGPFDYTPLIYQKGKSNAHTLSFFVTYFGPAQTVRGGYMAWHGDGKYGQGGDELEFLRKVPATWDDTKVLYSKIGRQLITARRSGSSWFVGGMTGDESFTTTLPLDFLESGKSYRATIFKDDPNGFSNGFCVTRKEVLTLDSKNSLPVNMNSAGGFVAIFDLIKQ